MLRARISGKPASRSEGEYSFEPARSQNETPNKPHKRLGLLTGLAASDAVEVCGFHTEEDRCCIIAEMEAEIGEEGGGFRGCGVQAPDEMTAEGTDKEVGHWEQLVTLQGVNAQG